MAANQFDIARKKAEQQSRGALQEQQDALKRRFASLGATSSGAALKQQQMAAEKSQEQLQSVNEAIGAQESAENLRRQDIQEERQFQKGMAEEGRKFAIAEREAGQGFQAAQTQKQMDFQDRLQTWSQSQAAKEFDLAMSQYEQDKNTTEFNKRLQAITAGKDLGLGETDINNLFSTGKTTATGAPVAPAASPVVDILTQQRQNEEKRKKEEKEQKKQAAAEARNI
jgi:hypothetical protein